MQCGGGRLLACVSLLRFEQLLAVPLNRSGQFLSRIEIVA
jgi:hypothetical protein